MADEIARESQASAWDLCGEWILESVGGYPPAAINIKSWRIRFDQDGHWSYGGELAGDLDGMTASGTGNWTMTSGVLECTAGGTASRSTPAIRDGALTLSPDPVLKANGKTSVETTYRRS